MFKLWARQDWLDRFGVMPASTTEEFEAYLEEAVNTVDGAIGLTDPVNLGETYPTLYGAFGVANQGTAAGQIDLDPDTGAIRYFPGLRRLPRHDGVTSSRLYSKGLIPAEIFSSDRRHLHRPGQPGHHLRLLHRGTCRLLRGEGENYVVVPPLTREAGETPVCAVALQPA